MGVSKTKGCVSLKKIVLAVLLILLIGLSPSAAFASSNGYDQFGYNNKARIFNGWYGYYDKSIEGGPILGTYDSWIGMKWSKDWVRMADQVNGAWVTNHITWYSNSIDEDSWYGWDDRAVWNEATQPDVSYKIEEFYKIMKVSDDSAAWNEYESAGAFDAGWGNYLPSGVPKYVVIQDVVKIYNAESGDLISTINLIGNANKGLGKLVF